MINKTGLKKWKNEFQRDEWHNVYILSLVLRDFMFFTPFQEEESKREEEDPFYQNNGNILMCQDRVEGYNRLGYFYTNIKNCGLHLNNDIGSVEDIPLVGKVQQLLDSNKSIGSESSSVEEEGLFPIELDEEERRVAKLNFKKGKIINKAYQSFSELFEAVNNGEEDDAMWVGVSKYLDNAYVGASGDADDMGKALWKAMKSTIHVGGVSQKIAKKLLKNMKEQKARRMLHERRSSRINEMTEDQRNELIQTSQNGEGLQSEDAIMKVARKGRTTQTIDDVLGKNKEGLGRDTQYAMNGEKEEKDEEKGGDEEKVGGVERRDTMDANLELEALLNDENIEIVMATCFKCGENIDGGVNSAICAMNCYFHESCFTCEECDIELSFSEGGKFFEQDGKPYCVKDFCKLFAPHLCSGCLGPFSFKEKIVSTGGRNWHINHFLCTVCGDPLEEKGSFRMFEDEPFCEECFAANNGICPECGLNVMDDPLEDDNKESGVILHKRLYHYPNCLRCFDCKSLLPTDSIYSGFVEGEGRRLFCLEDYRQRFLPHCEKCDDPLDEGVYVCGKPYHDDCVSCRTCGIPFENGAYFQHRSYPYCNDCYIDQFIPKCQKCNLPLDDNYVETDDGDMSFHPECFCCETCNVPFKDLDMQYFVSETDKKVYCEVHYEEQCSQTCFSCKNLITEGEIVNHEENNYHASCLICKVCDKDLNNEMFFTDLDDETKFLCDKHYKILSGRAKVCILCFDFITDLEEEVVIGGGKKTSEEEEDEETNKEEEEEEDTNEYIHKSCFCCEVCSDSLLDQRALRHEDSFYCQTHYAEKVFYFLFETYHYFSLCFLNKLFFSGG